MQLKEYQENKVKELEFTIQELLSLPERRSCIFQAPTGSGKTLMVAEGLKRLVKDRHQGSPLSFIWIAPRMLHGQSKEKLEKYYEDDREVECSGPNDLQDNTIQENEILFLNWESLNKKNNLLTMDNELDKNLVKIVENTKDEDREIVLIIDESHHSAKTESARNLIKDISPKVTLEVSATPHLLMESGEELPRTVVVEFTEVVEEEMIKKEVSINPEIDMKKVGSKSTDALVIESALGKALELRKKLKKEKSKVNPLVLIQLPNKRAAVLDKSDEIIKILDKAKINESNGKLAIWLSETKTPNLANTEKGDNETEVLIFKEAISLGWDCPRAAILVLFRDWKSFRFSIQTVGRIMRMPEWKHYLDDELNRGYVFTNLKDISIAEDISKGYITTYEAKRDNKIYKNIGLVSEYVKRQRERTRLSGKFSEIFISVATKNNLKKALKKKSKLTNKIIINGKIERIDKIIEHVHKEGLLKVKQTDAEIQYVFDLFIRENCSPFAPADSSGRIRTAIYKFFEKKMKIKEEFEIQNIVLSDDNQRVVAQNIEGAKEEYKKQVTEKMGVAKVERDVWEVPEKIGYGEKFKEVKKKRALMSPYYERKPSKPEEEFVKELEKSKDVVWWFKNGEGEKKYFAVSYIAKDGKRHGFYVDFIFQLKNGKIGLFDTKGGRTAEDAKPKAEALVKYIKSENKKRKKKLVGGILVKKGSSWRYNDNANYKFDENDLSGWKFFDFKKL